MKMAYLVSLRNDYYRAVIFMLIAYVSIAIMSVFVKLASHNIPASEILFFRFVIGLIFIAPLVKGVDLKPGKNKFVNMRNIAGLSSMLLMFYSLNYLPVSTSVLLMSTSSLFVPLFVLLLFNEKTSLSTLACTLIGFSGVYIIFSSPEQQVPIVYQLMGLTSAALAALAYIGIKKLSEDNSPMQIVFYFHLVSSVLIPVFLSYDWVLPSWYEFFLLCMVGFFGLAFQIFITKALGLATITRITPFIFIGVIISSVFDWIFWSNVPTVNFWIGAIIVLISASMLVALKEAGDEAQKR